MPRNIVVIGGGIIGSSTVYSLVHHPKFTSEDRVVLVEGTEIAAGASGKSGGFLALDWHGEATSSLAELSYNLHEQLAAKHGAEQWGYRKLDTLAVTVNTKKRSSASSVKLPPGLTWLDAPAIKGVRTLGTKSTTAQAHPRLLTRRLVELAQEKGAEVVIGKASSLDFGDDGRPRSLKVATEAGERAIDCTDVIITAGPWSGRVAKDMCGSRLRQRIQIDGTRAHSIVVKTHEPLSEHALFLDLTSSDCSGEPEIYCRPDGTAYICGAGDDEPLPASAADVRVAPANIAKLKKQAAAVSPSHLGDKGVVDAEQACYLPSTRRGTPLIGRLIDGVFLGAGHSCWGITLGPGTGHVLAEMLLDGAVKSADISALEP